MNNIFGALGLRISPIKDGNRTDKDTKISIIVKKGNDPNNTKPKSTATPKHGNTY